MTKLDPSLDHNPPRKAPAAKKTKKRTPRTKTKKAPVTDASSTGVRALLVVLGVTVLMLVLSYGLGLWSLLTGGDTLARLGVAKADLKSIVTGMTHFLWGTLTLIALIAALVGTFRWMMTPAKSKKMRRSHGIRSAVWWVVMAIFIAFWVVISLLISRVDAQQTTTTFDLITTDPVDVIGLEAPVRINFDIGKGLIASKVTEPQWRQITWDFESDGVIDARGPVVTHEFTDLGDNGGRYIVAVNVKYWDAQAEVEREYDTTKEVIINNEAIRAVLTPSVTSGPAPLTVDLSALESRDPDGQILEYAWDLDEDGTYEEAGPDLSTTSVTLDRVGEYALALRVRGVNNDTAEKIVQITVTEPETALTAVISANTAFDGDSPLTLELDGAQSFSKRGRIVKYEWQIEGEESPRLGQKTKVTLFEPGTYQMRLRVTNQDGENAEITQEVTVRADYSDREITTTTTPPMAAKSTALRVQAPQAVTFDTTSSTIKDPVSWEWDFESDGVVDAFTPVASHLFGAAGEFITTVTITDAYDNQFEQEYQITVTPAGTRAVIASDVVSGTVPLTVQLDGSGSTSDSGQIINYLWQFPGEAPIPYSAQIAYTFEQIGDWPVQLTVVTSDGDESKTEMLVSVRAQPVKAEFKASAIDGVAPLEVRFDPRDTQGTVFEWAWDFGDGKTSSQFQPTHIYRSPGNYMVKLQVKDAQGITSIVEQKITVRDPAER